MSQAGQTLPNAVIGAIITSVFYFLPGLNVIGPIFGGAVAGYLQKEGANGGIKVGGLKGVIMVIPAIAIAVVASSLVAGIPVIGGMLSGSIAIIVVLLVIHSLALGIVGGLVGGLVAGTEVDEARASTA